MFGTSELATRSLSFLFASLTLATGAIFAYGLGIGRQIVVTCFLGSSPFFCYYAQETKSYSLVLFLSTVLTGSVLALRDRRYWNFLNKRHRSILLGIYYISALLLSLTHYFALLFVVLLVVLNMIDRLIDAKRFRSVILLALISLWPIFHFLIWESPSRLARVSWIQVKPIVGTVSAFLMGVFPYVIPSNRRTVSSGGMDRYVDDSLKLYFKSINLIPTTSLDGTKFSLKLDKPLVGYHEASHYISDISKVNPDFQCWEPSQTWRGSTFIFLNKSYLVNPSEYGLDKCS